MNLMLALILTLIPNSPVDNPKPLTPAQISDIGCVAAIAIVAQDQKTQTKSQVRYFDVQERGRLWAGIVGDRVTHVSGQPREVIVFALRRAAAAERKLDRATPDYRARVTACIVQMDADIARESSVM